MFGPLHLGPVNFVESGFDFCQIFSDDILFLTEFCLLFFRINKRLGRVPFERIKVITYYFKFANQLVRDFLFVIVIFRDFPITAAAMRIRFLINLLWFVFFLLFFFNWIFGKFFNNL